MAHRGRKMEEYSKAYVKEACQLALSKIELIPCACCGHPVQRGYLCGHCDTDHPDTGQDRSCGLDNYIK